MFVQVLVCLIAPGVTSTAFPAAPPIKYMDVDALRAMRPRPSHPILGRHEWPYRWNETQQQPPCDGIYSLPHGNFHSLRSCVRAGVRANVRA